MKLKEKIINLKQKLSNLKIGLMDMADGNAVKKEDVINDVERQLNSLSFSERVKLSGALKNGKISLKFIK